MDLNDLYNYVFSGGAPCSQDIREHLPTLRKYAGKVNHITEFGVRTGNSTVALLSGKPKIMVSYDINDISKHPTKSKWDNNCITYNSLGSVIRDTNFNFIIGNTLEIEIEQTDLLFIDTSHNYKQLKEELRLHHDKVNKYIIFHDTETYGRISEDGSVPGIMSAIQEFIDTYKEWKIKKVFTNNNGLVIIEKGE